MCSRLVYVLLIALTTVWSCTPGAAAAPTADELQQEVAAVTARVSDLQAQLARLQQRLRELEQKAAEAQEQGAEADLAALRAAAAQQAAAEDAVPVDAGEVTFTSGELGLQALNPEISVTGDLISSYRCGPGATEGLDNNVRTLGIHLESYLDPYSRFKAAVPVTEDRASIGEAYFTRYGLRKDLNVTLGKFRQQFGIVNRWHKHSLDQIDFPLPLRQIFGPGGLNQTGASLEGHLPGGGPHRPRWQERHLGDAQSRNRTSLAAPRSLDHHPGC